MDEDVVFERRTRSDLSRAGRSEPIWHVLDRSGRPRAEAVRDLLNEWVNRLPADARQELIPRLRSTDNYEFLAAFWELYLAEVLRRCGEGPEFHPQVQGTSRRPDFRATGPAPFLFEATLASPSTAERAAQRRLDRLYDLLDRTPSDAFFIEADVGSVGSRTPSAKALRAAIDRWLEPIDPDELIAKGLTIEALDSLALRWQWEDWDVVLRPLPKGASHRGGAGDPLVGMESHGGGLIDTRSALRRSLREKAGAYGSPRSPFAIGVLVLDTFVDEDDVRQVLFGKEGIEVSISRGRVARRGATRAKDGFWYGPRPSHTRVSAGVIGLNLTPWTVGRVWPTTWLNPWATHPLSASLPFPVVERDSATGELVTRAAAMEPWQFFGLGPAWPG